jgi:hypothetical protein
MKIVSIIFLIAVFSSLSLAQEISIEKDFEKNRPKFLLERFSLGEDATSGYDYLIYKSKSKVVKIRSIWNGGSSNPPTVEDFYFKDGNLILYVKLLLDKKHFKTIVRGRNIALQAQEKLYLTDSKLTMWIENGKTVSASDPRWKEKEKSVLEQAKGEMESYQLNQEEN